MADEERTKVIKKVWRNWVNSGSPWPTHYDPERGRIAQPFLNIPAPLKIREPRPYSPEVLTEPVIDVLTFKREQGRRDGLPAVRVICEGVEVEMQVERR